MNKLMGFFELNVLAIPTVNWQMYKPSVKLDESKLWTIRSAVDRGLDLFLPRLVGADAQTAKEFADNLYEQIKGKGMVICYPYFVADKSGTLNIFQSKNIIEAVAGDLWNLVDKGDLTVSMEFENDTLTKAVGDTTFITSEEVTELLECAARVKGRLRDELMKGQSVLLEWSYAKNIGIDGKPTGEPYLTFYELRTV